MRDVKLVCAALGFSALLMACGAESPLNDGTAATAAARIKGGLESQPAAVNALSTAQAGALAVATQVAGPVGTMVSGAPAQIPGGLTGIQQTAVAAGTQAAQAIKGGSVISPEQATQLAQAEIARALNVAPGQVTVERTEQVDWSDSSLGCRQPNMMYAQVITPGFRVIVNAAGQRREVHTDMTGRAVVCETPTQ